QGGRSVVWLFSRSDRRHQGTQTSSQQAQRFLWKYPRHHGKVSTLQCCGRNLLYHGSELESSLVLCAHWADSLCRAATPRTLPEDPDRVCRYVALPHGAARGGNDQYFVIRPGKRGAPEGPGIGNFFIFAFHGNLLFRSNGGGGLVFRPGAQRNCSFL